METEKNGVQVNTEEENVKPEIEILEQEEQKVKFSATITQKKDGDIVNEVGISFELDKNNAISPDVVVGTLLNRLFNKMDLAKAAKAKYLDSRLPIYVKISSEQFSIDYGKMEDWFTAKLKFNSSDRSKLHFIDRLILATKSMLEPVEGTRLTTMAENYKVAVEAKTGKEQKRLTNVSQQRSLSGTVVLPKGELAEA